MNPYFVLYVAFSACLDHSNSTQGYDKGFEQCAQLVPKIESRLKATVLYEIAAQAAARTAKEQSDKDAIAAAAKLLDDQ